MADIFYGMDRGDQEVDVVTDVASPGKDIEIVVDDAVGLTKEEVLRAIQVYMANHILKEPDY